jgi:Ser/Thr protein kinase RdoA (MazF antagonist)
MDVAGHPFPGRSDLWRDGGVVIRRHDKAERGTLEWIHRLLSRLDCEAPKPVPYFNGSSVTVDAGVVWSAVTYVEGDPVGWSHAPAMFDLGAYLARFHAAARAVDMETQQTPVFAVDIGDGVDRARHVIHGDFTNHNVLAAGSPPRPCGVIDFANACVDVPLFDIGAALWRSGRPSQDAQAFDSRRVVDYVDGYCSVQPLDADDRAAVVGYLAARGRQIIVKQGARGVVDDGPQRKLAWLADHSEQLVAALTA